MTPELDVYDKRAGQGSRLSAVDIQMVEEEEDGDDDALYESGAGVRSRGDREQQRQARGTVGGPSMSSLYGRPNCSVDTEGAMTSSGSSSRCACATSMSGRFLRQLQREQGERPAAGQLTDTDWKDGLLCLCTTAGANSQVSTLFGPKKWFPNRYSVFGKVFEAVQKQQPFDVQND